MFPSVRWPERQLKSAWAEKYFDNATEALIVTNSARPRPPEVVDGYGKDLGAPLAPHDVRRTFAKLAYQGRHHWNRVRFRWDMRRSGPPNASNRILPTLPATTSGSGLREKPPKTYASCR